MMDLFINLMIAQALMGAFDTLYHHEFKVALPRQAEARLELSIHAIRAILYALVFAGLANYVWAGYWVWVLIAIILIELVLTLWDFIVEDNTRLLPNSERITHTLLAVNGGAAFVLLALELPAWYGFPHGLLEVDYGWRTVFLNLAAIGVFVSGLRDAYAAWSLQRIRLQLDLDLGGHKRLLISGGTGFIGSALIRELLDQGHAITVLSRNPQAAAIQFGGRLRVIKNMSELDGAECFDVVINLAGAPVVGWPWSERRKLKLMQSRLQTTLDMLDFVKRTQKAPQTWVQASAIGFYGPVSETAVDEMSPAGAGFAAELCQQWEGLTEVLQAMSIRCVVLRFGLVFGRSGGSLPMMLLPFRFGLGAVIGDGRQHMAWIHIEDLLRLIAQCVRDPSLHGKFNAVAPDCPSHRQFARASGRVLQRPVLMHIPAGLLRTLLGEMASMFVDGPEVVPRRLSQVGFEFRFPDLRAALMDLT